MQKLKENLCPNCGGNLKYEPSIGMNLCDCCGTEFNVGQFDQALCPDCGNKLVFNLDSQSLECSVCQSSFEVPKKENATQSLQIDNAIDSIIPFSVDEKKAKIAFITALSKTEAIPNDIYQKIGIIDFAGYYAPFYRYFGDYTATFHCSIGYDREEQYTEYENDYDAESGRSVRRPVTKTRTVTDWHPYSGNDVGDFCVDVCASNFFNSVDDCSSGFVNKMCGSAKYQEYNEQYTTGFRVLPFVIDTSTAVENDGNAQIDRVVASNISSKLPGDHYKDLSFNWQCNRSEFTLLKPVWYTKYAYDGSAYYVLTDGTNSNNHFGFAPQCAEKTQKYNNIKTTTWTLALLGVILGAIIFIMGLEQSEGLMAAGVITFIAGLIAGLIGYNVFKHAKVKDAEQMRTAAIEYERNPNKVFNRKSNDIKIDKTKQNITLTPKEKPLSFSNYSKCNLYFLFFILLLVFGSLWFIPGVINIFSPDTSLCIMGIMGTVLLTISFFCCWRGNAKVEKLKAKKNMDSTKNKQGKIVGLVCMLLVLLIGTASVIRTVSVISPPIKSSNNLKEAGLDDTVTSDSSGINSATINIDDYIGNWHISGQNYDSDYYAYERNLSVSKLGENQFSFELFYFRIGAIDCEVTLNGNKAEFTYTDGDLEVKGNLIFNENSIIVNITSSNNPYMPVETMTFDSRNNEVYDEVHGGNTINDSSSDSTCPRCGRALTDGETCDCTWCDICNAWMLGHGHGEGEEPVNSSTSHSSDDSSTHNGPGSTEDFVPLAPEVLSVTPHINADGDASILLDITISDLSLGEQSPSHYNAGENLTITVNGTKVNHETAWYGGKKWQIQIDNINLSDTKTFIVVLTNKYGISTTRTVTFP